MPTLGEISLDKLTPQLIQQKLIAEKISEGLAGSRWRKTGMVFTSSIGTPLDERNVRREFYAFLNAAQ